MAASTPYYGGSTPYRARTVPLEYAFPRGGGNNVQVAGLHGLRGTDDPSSMALSPTAYTIAALAGSITSGALVGYVASKKKQGAIRGAAFMGGAAMLSDAGVYFSYGRPGMAAVAGVIGLAGLGYALHSLSKV